MLDKVKREKKKVMESRKLVKKPKKKEKESFKLK
jgi:hypothetical protein